ncbi:hypothetical protein LN042_30405 [Kitasatospora sp. RB6PN24]|uniref:hypothetical protein n=1 Tax=Kitasatospora humi TaxID=2893891 RepID=UPI001E3BD656|nr:hypothetical protein [Kitasatospora humi]MCC9311324.1 hypothetical protein [Kitasatospora humi]
MITDPALPECRCPHDCGGRPELRYQLRPGYPAPEPGTPQPEPPEHPYAPGKRGELVYDTLNGRVGAFMDRSRNRVYLRPERGGTEWDVDGKWLVELP